MKKLLLTFILLSLISCGEKKYEDYDPNDFYEVVGVIIDVKGSSDYFTQVRGLNVTYHYFVNDSIYYVGLAEKIGLSIMNNGFGGLVRVKVHKKDPKINFYWGESFVEGLTVERAKIFQKHIDSIHFSRMKRKHEMLKKKGLEYNNYYLNDSLRK